MNQVYEKFEEGLKNNEIVQLKRKSNVFEIIVVAMEDEYDTWKYLQRLNQIFEKYGQTEVFKNFILTECILIKKFCSINKHRCLFLVQKKIWRFFIALLPLTTSNVNIFFR